MSGSRPSRLSVDDEVDFVNREIDRHLDVWKNRSDRAARDMAPVVALSAAFISAAALLLAAGVSDQRRFYVSSIPFLFFLSTSGLFLGCGLTRRNLQGTIDLLRVDMLRSYFVDRSSVLEQYVPPRHVTVADLRPTLQHLYDQRLSGATVRVVLVASAGLNGVAIGIATWWVLEPVALWAPLLAGGAIAVGSLLTGWRHARRVQRRTAWRLASTLGVELSDPNNTPTHDGGAEG